MAYSNINVGVKGKSSDKEALDQWVNQLRADSALEAEREALVKGNIRSQPTASDNAISNAFIDAGLIDEGDSTRIPQDDTYSDILEGVEAVPKGAAEAKAMAAQVAQGIPPIKGHNPSGDVYSGPQVQNYTDIDNMNRGAQHESIAEPLRNILNSAYDSEGNLVDKDTFNLAAEMLGTDENTSFEMNRGVIRDHKVLSNKVIEEINNIATGWNKGSAERYVQKVKADLRADPETISEFMKTWMTDFKTLESHGIPNAFSDAALHAVLQVMMKNKWNAKNKEEELRKTGVLNAQDEHNASIAQDEEIGGLIEGAFNVKNGTPTTRAIGGAIARRVVTEALGSTEYGDGTIEGLAKQGKATGGRGIKYDGKKISYETSPAGLMKAGLFHSKLVKTNDGNTRWDIELTQKGAQYAESMMELGNLVIPGLKKDVNANPPQTEKFNDIMSSKQQQHKEDKNRSAGVFKDTNKGIQALNTTGFSIDSHYAQLLSESFNNEEAIELFEGKNFIDISGLEVNNITHKRDANGERFKESYIRKEYLLNVLPNGQEVRTQNTNPGNKVPNPAFNPSDPESGELQWLTETNLGDRMKDLKFKETNQWIADHVGDEKFYYTHKIGGSKRVHIEQTIGNYHSDKLSRSLIQSISKFQYSFKNKQDMVNLKAGILKKFGYNKAKHGSNQQLANDFDAIVKGWVKTQSSYKGKGFAVDLIKEAQKEEGWASLGSMSEAMRLYEAESAFKAGNGRSSFTSKFLTEIDGTANGLAINSMMSGDETVAKLTGLLEIDPSDDFTSLDDVYTITSNMFKSQYENYTGKKLAGKFEHAWGELMNSYGNPRNLSKTALMVFGYGAGAGTIKIGFKQHLEEVFERDAELRDKISSMTDGKLNDFIDLSGDMMVNAVETNFPQMRTLAKVLSSITGYAASIGIAPSVLTDDYDYIEFGLTQRIANDEASFSGSYAKGSKKKVGRKIKMTTFDRVNNPKGVIDEFGDRVDYDPEIHKISDLKAAKQAPVLVTQSIDALIMMRAIAKLKKKIGASFSAGQIFDGVLMPPAHAQQFSDALHQEMLKIGKTYSSTFKLTQAISELDTERFKKIAELKKKGKKELTEKDKLFLKMNKNPVEFFLVDVPSITVYNPKNPKKPFIITVEEAIRRLDKRRDALIKKLDASKMSQYGWNFKAIK